ncbi:UNVERIFIED_CONTAM: hypothetical protein Slati_1384500 [Sesamum latifolium]|uniref:Uncharacterized protein n=1 Tax=Sesamum latifolium TaxID=2727402 RepID=A0AAW2X3Y0_9LAMI
MTLVLAGLSPTLIQTNRTLGNLNSLFVISNFFHWLMLILSSIVEMDCRAALIVDMARRCHDELLAWDRATGIDSALESISARSSHHSSSTVPCEAL